MAQQKNILDLLGTTKLTSYEPRKEGYVDLVNMPTRIRKSLVYYSYEPPIVPNEYIPPVEPYVTSGYVLSGYVENT